MTYSNANIAFDAMDIASKERVIRTFELIFGETGFANVREAFAAAVKDECKAIEVEKNAQ